MRRVLLVCALAACGRTGFASLPCDDAAPDSAIDAATMPASHSTLTLDKADAGEPLADFPLLVKLDDSRAARDLLDAQATNMRFLDAGGHVIPHELDILPYTGQSPLLVWVRVPMIAGTSTTIQVEIGGALPDEATGSVWGSDYEAVYHLNDGTDSTHRHDGAAQGPVTAVGIAGCAIGNCQSFDGSSAFYNISDMPSLDLPVATISGWIYQRTATVNEMAIVSRQQVAANQDFMLGTFNDQYFGEIVTAISGDQRMQIGNVTLGHWTHMTMTFDGSNSDLFVDGTQIATTPGNGNMEHDANAVLIGATMGAAGYLDGMADEVRLERVARDYRWIGYEDLAMRDNLISYGPIER
jgi:predicted small lipoprotein YifL